MNHPVLTVRPLTLGGLPGIVAWFEDPDTQRFLGGPDWPAAMLANADRSIGTTFRGATQTGAHHYLAHTDDNPVGYIDCGTFDRCTVYGGEGPDGPIIAESSDAATGSIPFVIDPQVRRRGLGRAMIAALTEQPELHLVELFEAGVEPANTASRRCLEAAGFRVRSEEPDYEGMLYYVPGGRTSIRTPDCWRERHPDPAAARRRGRRGRLSRAVGVARRLAAAG